MQSKIIAVSVFAKTPSLRALPLSYFPHSGTPLLGCPQSHGFYISIPMFAAIPSIDFRTPVHRLEPAMVSSRIRTYTFLSMSDDLSISRLTRFVTNIHLVVVGLWFSFQCKSVLQKLLNNLYLCLGSSSIFLILSFGLKSAYLSHILLRIFKCMISLYS